MAAFPTLKTGAIAQYPMALTEAFSTQVYRFVDGSEQSFAGSAGALRQWSIRLDLLDEAEIETLREFFVAQEGRAESFSFTDPWSGTVYPNCSFGSDTLALQFGGPMQNSVQVVVKENR